VLCRMSNLQFAQTVSQGLDCADIRKVCGDASAPSAPAALYSALSWILPACSLMNHKAIECSGESSVRSSLRLLAPNLVVNVHIGMVQVSHKRRC
jgi:hypothetical protein